MVDRVLARPVAGRVAARIGGVRGRGIALLWHRVRPEGAHPHEVVRGVATEAFAQQLDVLCRLGDIVPLEELERPRGRGRPRFALTFDDDDPGHAEHTLPLLAAHDLPATFFLSGRWRGGSGPYWWELLEAEVRTVGAPAVAVAYGLPPDTDPVRIAATLTGTSRADALARTSETAGRPPMDQPAAARLVAAGMEIGFHTRDHPSLPTLRDDELRAAVHVGRAELAAELGVLIVRFAYPHGHVDDRVAAAVRAQGYRSAWTTRKRTVSRGQDPMLLGRWDLGHLDIDGFRLAVLRALARPSP